MTLAALIPAYQPDANLVELVRALAGGRFAAIVIVDDGSSAGAQRHFRAAAEVPGVVVLRHPENRGKGAALKTGLAWVRQHYPGAGAVTADADGQHQPEDIFRVACRLARAPEALVLGARALPAAAPLRSRLGNRLARAAVRVFIRLRLSDTQTGLRGIPPQLIPDLLRISSDRYDFELSMLMAARRAGMPVVEEPIRAIYIDENSGSHFRPLGDTLRIAAAILGQSGVAGWAAILLAAAAAAWGLWSNGLLEQPLWDPGAIPKLLGFSAAHALLAAAFYRWLPRWYPHALLLAAAVLAAAAVGPLPVLAVGLLFLAAAAVGTMLLSPRSGAESGVALLAGLAVYMGIFGVTAHFPVNYPIVWAALLIAPVAAAMRQRDALRKAWRIPAMTRADVPAAAVLWLVLLIYLLAALEPEVSADGLAMHLTVPAWIGTHHRWTFDFRQYAWAVMPMGGEWVFSLAYLLGGEAAARLANFALLAVTIALVYHFCRARLSRRTALLLVSAFASTPLVLLVTGSLFVENVWTALLLGGLAAAAWFAESGALRYACVSGLLLGTAMAAKLGALAFAAPLLLYLLYRARGSKPGLAGVAACFVAAAAPPYVYAAVRTGNPVFPFLNSVFRSPWFDSSVSLADPRFPPALSWRVLWDATFHSARFLEGRDGSLGLTVFLLAPLLLVSVRRRWPAAAWLASASAACGCLANFGSVGYLRYVYPALGLVAIPAAVALASCRERSRRLYATTVAILAAAVCVNLWLLPSSGWNHGNFWTPRQAYLLRHAPARRLIDTLNREHPGQPVAFLRGGPIAGLDAPAYTDGWHTPAFSRALFAAGSPEDVAGLMQRFGIRYVVAPVPGLEGNDSVPIEDFLGLYTHPEEVSGNRCLSHILDIPRRSPAIQEPAPSGSYDDRDPHLVYSGAWLRDDQFPGAYRGTLTYCGAAGAEVRFRFRGTGLDWICTRAANRGSASVWLDGRLRTVDLHAPETAWQSQIVFRSLPEAEHTLLIRSNGDGFVDVDALTVR